MNIPFLDGKSSNDLPRLIVPQLQSFHITCKTEIHKHTLQRLRVTKTKHNAGSIAKKQIPRSSPQPLMSLIAHIPEAFTSLSVSHTTVGERAPLEYRTDPRTSYLGQVQPPSGPLSANFDNKYRLLKNYQVDHGISVTACRLSSVFIEKVV